MGQGHPLYLLLPVLPDTTAPGKSQEAPSDLFLGLGTRSLPSLLHRFSLQEVNSWQDQK